MTGENDMERQFWCPQMKFYWKTAAPIHLSIVWGCFCAMPPGLSGGDGEHRRRKANLFTMWPFAEEACRAPPSTLLSPRGLEGLQGLPVVARAVLCTRAWGLKSRPLSACQAAWPGAGSPGERAFS